MTCNSYLSSQLSHMLRQSVSWVASLETNNFFKISFLLFTFSVLWPFWIFVSDSFFFFWKVIFDSLLVIVSYYWSPNFNTTFGKTVCIFLMYYSLHPIVTVILVKSIYSKKNCTLHLLFCSFNCFFLILFYNQLILNSFFW